MNTNSIKAAHDRYFCELKGIAECVDLLKGGAAPPLVVDELERRVRAFCQTLYEVGVQLAEEES